MGVLLIAGDASQAEQLREAVQAPDQPEPAITQVASVRDGLEALRLARYDVAVVDLELASGDRLAGLRRLLELAPELAIVVRGRADDEQAKLQALAAGAQDYVARDVPESQEVLRRSIMFARARVHGERASRRLAAIVAASGEAIIGLTFDGEITSWNQSAERIYGYPGGEAIGRSLSMLSVAPADTRRVEDALARVREGRTGATIETVHRRADGQAIDVGLTISCVRGAAGMPVAAAAVARELTEAKRIERERERAVADLREAQLIGRMGSWRISPDEGDSFSEELHRLLGLDPCEDRLTFARWLNHVDPEDLHRVQAAMAGAHEGRQFELDCRIRPTGGAQRVLHLVGQPDPTDPRFVAGIAQDVTELRALERALRSSRAELVAQRELLARVFDSAPIGMAMASPDGRFLRVNRALREILDYDEAELVGLALADLADGSDAASVAAGLERLRASTDEIWLAEVRLLRRDRGRVWTQLSTSLICDDEGTPLHLVIQAADISAHKDVEAALRLERDHTATILAAIGEGYALTENAEILAVNDALCELTGYSREELVGTVMPWQFWPEGTLDEHEAIRRQFTSEDGGTLSLRLRRKDGTDFDAEVTVRPAHRPDGSRLGWVSAVRDVSERKRYEAELERLATQDPLTGLANHRVFHQRLADHMAAAIRHRRQISVAVLDLDHFKQVNDRFGHVVGDHVLEAVAERLRTVVRQGELLARVGGEEFAWILPDADIDGAHVAAERARRVISGTPFEQVGTVTISVGVGSRGMLRDATALYERADGALYAAKRQGRNRTIRWDRVADRVVASKVADG